MSPSASRNRCPVIGAVIGAGLREDNIRAIFERCEAITRRFAERLLDGKRDLRALWDLPLDLLIAPVSLGYYFIGRFWFAKTFVASRACDTCGACIAQCPMGALKLVDDRPFWTYRCESCMRCMNQCPKRAIETAHGFAVGLPVLLSIVLSMLVYPALQPLSPCLLGGGHLAGLLRNAFIAALMLTVLMFSYRLMHRGLRIRLVERIVIATSLTHFGFWRRYRAPKKFGGASSPDENASNRQT